MKILMVNKFLRPVGGAETYLLKLGAYWTAQGHQVEYFGMDHPDNCVGNRWGQYTAEMDFYGSDLLSKASYLFKVIYSSEAKKKMGFLLEQFRPDVLHINNFNYQLTPSILLAAEEYRKNNGKKLRVVYTAHDSQLVCPSHLMYRPKERRACEECLVGGVGNCIRGRCIHHSFARSCLGALESIYWRWRGVYRSLDVVVCPSEFMKTKLDSDSVLAARTVVLHNFVEHSVPEDRPKQDYVLYFGRFSEEKGIHTLLQVCRDLPQIPFVFAGGGPLEDQIGGIANVRNAGFLSGQPLKDVVQGARFSVCPSECNENCPFSVMESIMLGTPVLGSDRGGIAELIEDGKTGWLFPAGDRNALRNEIERIWNSDEPELWSKACQMVQFDSLSQYGEKLLELYRVR